MGRIEPRIEPNERRLDGRPVLLFFTDRRSGPARRMASLVAWVGVTEKRRLRVLTVDIARHADLARALDVTVVPTLVLHRGATVLERHEGRATGNEIADMLSRHLAGDGSRRRPEEATTGRPGGATRGRSARR